MIRWCIKNSGKRGTLNLDYLHTTKGACELDFGSHYKYRFDTDKQGWEMAKGRGYRAVRVTVEELKP